VCDLCLVALPSIQTAVADARSCDDWRRVPDMMACNECLPFPSRTPNDMSHAALTCEGALLDVAVIDADLAGKLYRALPVPLLPASSASDTFRGRHHRPLTRYFFPSLVLTRHLLRTLLNASSLASVSASPLSSKFSESGTPPLSLQCSCCVHPTPPVSATAGLHLLGFGVRERAAAVDVVVGIVRAVARGERVAHEGAAAAALGTFAGDGAQLGGSSRGSSCSAGEGAPADDGLIFFSFPVDGGCSTSAAAGDGKDGNASPDASGTVATTKAEDRATPRMKVVHRASGGAEARAARSNSVGCCTRSMGFALSWYLCRKYSLLNGGANCAKGCGQRKSSRSLPF